MNSYKRKIAWAIAGWFVLAVILSALGLLRNESSRIGLGVALLAALPVVVFSAWFATSKAFRRFALSLNPRALTLAQSWRILGITFVVLHAYGMLPAVFALPAGFGDMAVGATAPLVALKLARPERRRSFLLWQLVGAADLFMAVGLGVASGLLDPSGPSTGIMSVLPLSLAPTFFVPLLLLFHIICIAQAMAGTFSDSVAAKQSVHTQRAAA